MFTILKPDGSGGSECQEQMYSQEYIDGAAFHPRFQKWLRTKAATAASSTSGSTLNTANKRRKVTRPKGKRKATVEEQRRGTGSPQDQPSPSIWSLQVRYESVVVGCFVHFIRLNPDGLESPDSTCMPIIEPVERVLDTGAPPMLDYVDIDKVRSLMEQHGRLIPYDAANDVLLTPRPRQQDAIIRDAIVPFTSGHLVISFRDQAEQQIHSRQKLYKLYCIARDHAEDARQALNEGVIDLTH